MTMALSQYPFVGILHANDEDVDKTSAVQLDQIRTIDIEERVEQTFGHVSDEKMAEINAAIKVSLGLD
jgi:mRNA interferase MazF